MQNSPPDDDLFEDDLANDAVISSALARSFVLIATIIVLVGGGLLIWRLSAVEPVIADAKPVALPDVRTTSDLKVPSIPFTDITEDAGIDFVHYSGATGEKLLPETMYGGCAFFDFDNDGDPDILLTNGRPWEASGEPNAPLPTQALYRNDGDGHFIDVTAQTGLDVSMFGMGVAVGDYDGDGWSDVYLSALGKNRLFRNDKGTFTDVTDAAGVAGGATDWGTSCGFFDYDVDGDLDLFVCNYVTWSREFDLGQAFMLTGVGRAYGRPQEFPGAFCDLFRNDGDGHFTEVSAEVGIEVRNPATDVPVGKSLGVTFADFDDDGRPEIIVANDTVQNFLFHNQRDGTFVESAALSGVAYDEGGNARGAMGIDVGRFRNDAQVGIAIGNFATEMTALYVAPAGMQFTDEATASGLGPQTRQELTFAVLFVDVDLDGRLDVFTANGHLENEINKVQPSQRYEQSPQLFWNCGDVSTTEYLQCDETVTSQDLLRPMVGRGAATADIDGDGDLDLLVATTGGRPRLLRNDQQLGHHWLRVRLRGASGNTDAIGAKVRIRTGETEQFRTVMPTRGYLSQSELPVSFGLGDRAQVDELQVTWPNGETTVQTNLKVDQVVDLIQR